MKNNDKRILETYKIIEAQEIIKINLNQINYLKEKINEMLRIARIGTFIDDVQKTEFYKRLNNNNSKLSFFEKENKELARVFKL
jgi:hypothetical protein